MKDDLVHAPAETDQPRSGQPASEIVQIDGEPWEIKQALDDFWIGSGVLRPLRGCLVSARTREALIEGIPKVRDQHEIASMAMRMEGAIITAFKAVLDEETRSRHTASDRRAQIEQTRALCTELWPWLFASPQREGDRPVEEAEA
jgi:hypothetical protein